MESALVFFQAILFVYFSLGLIMLGIVLSNWKLIRTRVYYKWPTAPDWLVYAGVAIFVLFPLTILGPLLKEVKKAIKK